MGFGIEALNHVHATGVEAIRHYQPWNILFAMKWAVQEAEAGADRRPMDTLNDFHVVLNLLHEAEGGSIIREPCAWQEAQQIRIIFARNFDAFLPSNIWVAALGVYLPKKTCPLNLA